LSIALMPATAPAEKVVMIDQGQPRWTGPARKGARFTPRAVPAGLTGSPVAGIDCLYLAEDELTPLVGVVVFTARLVAGRDSLSRFNQSAGRLQQCRLNPSILR
jgi:hypothetical protein